MSLEPNCLRPRVRARFAPPPPPPPHTPSSLFFCTLIKDEGGGKQSVTGVGRDFRVRGEGLRAPAQGRGVRRGHGGRRDHGILHHQARELAAQAQGKFFRAVGLFFSLKIVSPIARYRLVFPDRQHHDGSGWLIARQRAKASSFFFTHFWMA